MGWTSTGLGLGSNFNTRSLSAVASSLNFFCHGVFAANPCQLLLRLLTRSVWALTRVSRSGFLVTNSCVDVLLISFCSIKLPAHLVELSARLLVRLRSNQLAVLEPKSSASS